jgi:hypothetical protein
MTPLTDYVQIYTNVKKNGEVAEPTPSVRSTADRIAARRKIPDHRRSYAQAPASRIVNNPPFVERVW